MDRQQGRLMAVTERLKKTEKRLLRALKSKHRRHSSRLRVTRQRQIRRGRRNDDVRDQVDKKRNNNDEDEYNDNDCDDAHDHNNGGQRQKPRP